MKLKITHNLLEPDLILAISHYLWLGHHPTKKEFMDNLKDRLRLCGLRFFYPNEPKPDLYPDDIFLDAQFFYKKWFSGFQNKEIRPE